MVFGELLEGLFPQVEAYPGQVEVVALRNPGGLAQNQLAGLRQALLTDARGTWISFVDDDDLVSSHYVKSVMEALEQDPDFVAFTMAYYEAGVLDSRPVFTGLHLERWSDSLRACFRDITHVNPVRTSIARQAGFPSPPGASAEDWQYVEAVRPLLAGGKQVVINDDLYHYRHNWTNSVQNGSVPFRPPGRLPRINHLAFRWHPESE